MLRKMKLSTNLLAAALIGLPAMLTAQSAAGQWSSGACTGVQNSITAAQPVVRSGSLSDAYDRVRAVITEAEDANLARSRDIRGPLGELVETLEGRAMAAFEEAYADYFAGNHESALAKFEELAGYEGLEAAREAEGELRQENSRAQWRELRATVTAQIEQADFAGANADLREMERRARRIGYKDTMNELLVAYSDIAASHVAQAKDALEAERYEDAYGPLYEISRLTPLRATSAEARRLLGEHRNDPGMRQAQMEYESADMLADIKLELADAEGRNNAQQIREGAQRKLEQLATRYEGTRAAAEAERLASELGEQLAAR